MSEVRFPEGLVALKYHGYYYSKQLQKVYSIKSGVLKEMKPVKRWLYPRSNPAWFFNGWRLSNKGKPVLVERFNITKDLVEGTYVVPYYINN